MTITINRTERSVINSYRKRLRVLFFYIYFFLFKTRMYLHKVHNIYYVVITMGEK